MCIQNKEIPILTPQWETKIQFREKYIRRQIKISRWKNRRRGTEWGKTFLPTLLTVVNTLSMTVNLYLCGVSWNYSPRWASLMFPYEILPCMEHLLFIFCCTVGKAGAHHKKTDCAICCLSWKWHISDERKLPLSCLRFSFCGVSAAFSSSAEKSWMFCRDENHLILHLIWCDYIFDIIGFGFYSGGFADRKVHTASFLTMPVQ